MKIIFLVDFIDHKTGVVLATHTFDSFLKILDARKDLEKFGCYVDYFIREVNVNDV